MHVLISAANGVSKLYIFTEQFENHYGPYPQGRCMTSKDKMAALVF